MACLTLLLRHNLPDSLTSWNCSLFPSGVLMLNQREYGAAEMGGVDLIVFTGGVGENSKELRESVCSGLEFMGVEFDCEANNVRGEDKILSKPESKVKVAVIATNEELVIATDTYNLVK